jgi:hypothetical protein
MPDRVDAAVETVQAAGVDPLLDRIPREPQLQQLPSGNDPVLKPSQLTHRLLTWTT